MRRMIAIMRAVRERATHTSGFSLVDVIVAVGIVMMITGISITYNRSSEQRLRIFKSQAVLVGAINRAKSYASERFIGKNVPDGSFACAFGVRLDADAHKVIIFQDVKATNIYNCVEGDGTYIPSVNFSANTNPIIEEVDLDSNLTMTVLSNGISVSPLSILFVPPEMKVMTNRNFPVVVGFSGAAAGYSSTTISSSGQITTQ